MKNIQIKLTKTNPSQNEQSSTAQRSQLEQYQNSGNKQNSINSQILQTEGSPTSFGLIKKIRTEPSPNNYTKIPCSSKENTNTENQSNIMNTKRSNCETKPSTMTSPTYFSNPSSVQPNKPMVSDHYSNSASMSNLQSVHHQDHYNQNNIQFKNNSLPSSTYNSMNRDSQKQISSVPTESPINFIKGNQINTNKPNKATIFLDCTMVGQKNQQSSSSICNFNSSQNNGLYTGFEDYNNSNQSLSFMQDQMQSSSSDSMGGNQGINNWQIKSGSNETKSHSTLSQDSNNNNNQYFGRMNLAEDPNTHKPNEAKFSNQFSMPIVGANHTNNQLFNGGGLPQKYAESPQNNETIPCITHPDQKSQYYHQEDNGNFLFYCSQCAVQAALKGKELCEIAPSSDQSVTQSMLRSSIDSEIQSHRMNLKDVFEKKKINIQTLTDEQNLRKLDIERFIQDLDESTTKNRDTLKILEQRKEMVQRAFLQEKKKLEFFMNNLVLIVQNQTQRALYNLNNFQQDVLEQYVRLDERVAQNKIDMNNIKTDIFQNFDNILLNMDLKPFKMIIKKYSEKIQSNNALIERHQIPDFVSSSLTNTDLLQEKFEKEFTKALTSIFHVRTDLFQLSQGSFQRSNTQPAESNFHISKPPINQRMSQIIIGNSSANDSLQQKASGSLDSQIHKTHTISNNRELSAAVSSKSANSMFSESTRNSSQSTLGLAANNTSSHQLNDRNVKGVYISFENQEMFENALKAENNYANLDHRKFSPQSDLNAPPKNSFLKSQQRENELPLTPDLQDTVELSLKNLEKPHQNSQIAYQIHNIFNPEPNTNTSQKTGSAIDGGQFNSITDTPVICQEISQPETEIHISNNTSQSGNSIRNSVNDDQCSGGPFQTVSPMPKNQQVSQIFYSSSGCIVKGSVVAAKNSSLLHQSNKDSFESSGHNILRSPNNAKYLDLLEKVNATQSFTNNFYGPIIKEGVTSGSPQELQVNQNITNTTDVDHSKNFGSNSLEMENSGNGRQMAQRKPDGRGPEHSKLQESNQENNNSKQIQNYEGFMNFIEKQLDIEKEQQRNLNHNLQYQKTLFFSPHFKEGEQNEQSQPPSALNQTGTIVNPQIKTIL